MSTRSADRRSIRESTGALALAMLAVALLGGALALGLALATGALHASSHATTVVEQTPATATASASGSWRAVYSRTAPGTVAITVAATRSASTPFGQTEQQATALGSGYVLNGQGDIITVAHVVEGATSIRVAFEDGTTRTASVLGKDESSDVAVLHVNTSGLTLHPLSLGSSRALAVGDPLAVIGDALGFDRSLSTGVVSGLDRTIQAPNGFTIAHAIQTDAALNPGNSGGPVLDSSGQVIGISDQIATGNNEFGRSTTETSTGVGFAVPIDMIKAELAQLEHGKTPTHAYLGVSTASTSSSQTGALVAAVQAGSPAAEAGLRPGDLIIGLDGTPIRSSGDLIAALAAAHPGEKAQMTVQRGSRRITVTAKLTSQPAQAPSQ
jgi:S1-C subfamily serine protease